MSARQIRNHRKAARRRERVLAAANAFHVDGYSIRAEAFDFGNQLHVSMARQSDGLVCGIAVRTDRLWRRMDGAPARAVDALLRRLQARVVRPESRA